MTVLNIMDGLIARLGEALKEFPLKLQTNDPNPFKIFRHKIPERLNKKLDYSKKDTHAEVYPFCVVKIDKGKKEANVSNQDSVFNIIVGVKNEDHDGQGYDDVMTCIQTLWDDFNENPVVANFHKLKYEIEWALDDSDEEMHPFYYGVIRLVVESPSMQYVGGYESGERSY